LLKGCAYRSRQQLVFAINRLIAELEHDARTARYVY